MSGQHVFEVGEADFQQKVMMRSQELPVVAEFYSAGPRGSCAALSTLAAEYGGRFELARVDAQHNQRLAMMLQIRAVPTVMVFRDGRPVDAFQGDQPADVLRQVIDQYVEAPEEEPLEMAKQALEVGRSDLADRFFKKALADNPKNGEALIGLARLALQRNATKEAQGFIDRIEEGDPFYDAGQRLKGVFGFARDAADPAQLQAKIEAKPSDAEAWYRLGATHATQGRYAEACEAFLKVVKLDRELREDGGRAALLALFDFLGGEHELVGTYRRKLASLLF